MQKGFEKIDKVLKPNAKKNFSAQSVKPPKYNWQELALNVIKELDVPAFKRNSVFKICKDNPPEMVKRAMNDTRELCQTGTKWKYFFKIINSEKK